MTNDARSRYKFRAPRPDEAEALEPVWGNGCELRGCLQPSVCTFLLCPDGVRREFCDGHQNEGVQA